MSFCFFNSLSKGKYSYLLIVEAFSNSNGNTSSAVKIFYLPSFPDDKQEILAVSLSKLY